MELFGRYAVIKTGNVTLNSDDLTVEFEAPFDDDMEPNESKITIYNLSQKTVNQLKRNQQLTLDAGYKQDHGVLLSGYISKVENKGERTDVKTTIYVLDTKPFDTKKTVKKSYKKGIKASQILRDLIASFSLKVAVLKLPKDKVYTKGYTVNGEIIEQLNKIAKDCGASAYINKGQLYIRSLKEGDDTRFKLSSDTGLIGSPEPFEEEVDGRIIKGYKVKCLLQYRLTTASIVEIQSKTVNGKFRVRKGRHYWNGNEFYTEMEVI
ncbi:hypothetical protein HNR63_001111 [Anoxybacillus kamchatkensis]|uniref:phage protein n=1 Tax=Anoxybacillus ayderensis TaxID=265546 RepID=UPI0015EB3EB6|nr:hypothetical protein [Anoxybacillus ayderensis]MBA2878057.1 hypothetical protein [Anoxybacillus ayderensis]